MANPFDQIHLLENYLIFTLSLQHTVCTLSYKRNINARRGAVYPFKLCHIPWRRERSSKGDQGSQGALA